MTGGDDDDAGSRGESSGAHGAGRRDRDPDGDGAQGSNGQGVRRRTQRSVWPNDGFDHGLGSSGSAGLKLYTATLAHSGRGGMLQLFHASIAAGPEEIVARIAIQIGRPLAGLADVRAGFHPAVPLVIALVPDVVGNVIRYVELNCLQVRADRFAIDIRQNVRL